jgi:DHA2 family multidrug resistance protein-like MFS transporter
MSAVTTGLLMTPWPATAALMAPLAGRLADRYPAGILGSVGLVVLGSGFMLLSLLPAHPTTADILWRIAVCGGGMGLFQQPNARSIIMSAPLARSGGAGAIQGTARLLGQSIGAALVALVFGLAGGHGAKTAIVLAACFAAAGTLTSFSRMFDFVRAPLSGTGSTQPADRP